MIDSLSAAAGRDVSRETLGLLEEYVCRLQGAAVEQNLIAASTLNSIWDRHILDSAQLAHFEPRPGSTWVDIGSGAGLPGVVIALLVGGPVTLVEPRRLRAAFLSETIEALGLGDRVTVVQSKIERVGAKFDVITGRAVAALDRFLDLAHHLSHQGTIWVLPKGRNAESELAQAKRSWHCEATVEPSCTDPESRIVVLTRVGIKRQ